MKNKLTVLAFLLLLVTGLSFAQVTTPTVTAPLQNSVGVSIEPTFSWSSGGTYVIEVSTSATSWVAPDLVYTSTVAVASGHTIPETSKLTNGVAYYWRAVAGAGTGTFTTVSSAMPYLMYPSNGAILSGTSTTFSWMTGAVGLRYYMEVDDDINFGSKLVDVNTTNSYYSVLNTVFTQGGTYYWRVIAKNIAGSVVYNYSNIWQFSMPGLPEPIASYPTGNVSIYNNPPTLYWYSTSYNPKVTEYIVHYKNAAGVGTNGTSIALSATEGCFTTTSTNPYVTIPFSLTPGVRYYWRVAAYDGSSDKTLLTNWSPEESFSVYGNVGFALCYPSYPLSGVSVSGTPTFYWYSASFSPVMFYTLEIDNNSNFGSVTVTKADISSSSYALTSAEAALLSSGATYYWRVSASFTSGGTYGPVSTSGSFVYTSSTATATITTPYPSSPTSGTVVGVTNPTLIWSVYSADPLQFKVTWATNPAMTGSTFTTAVESGWINSNSFILSGLTAGATYYWQVKARLATTLTEGEWSTVAWFTTAAGSASVVPLAGSPINGMPINNTNATLSWILPTMSISPLKYEVQYSKKADFSDAVSINDLDKANCELKNLDKDAVYYWRASSKTNSGLKSNYSAPTSFSTGSTVTSIGNKEELPTHFELSQNYPNPFNPTTIINYSLVKNAYVTLKIYDMLGREVATLVNKESAAGKFSVQWNGTDSFGYKVASGIYVYRITAGDFVSSKKMLLIK
ncbi:MAG: T9SS type A sorting domain-containing protein [Melioribacteraceae bacterium]